MQLFNSVYYKTPQTQTAVDFAKICVPKYTWFAFLLLNVFPQSFGKHIVDVFVILERIFCTRKNFF